MPRHSGGPVVTANTVLRILNLLLSIITIPLQMLTTLILGILVNLTFGLLLLPISLIWMSFLGGLLALSWLSGRIPAGRIIVGLFGVPWALLATIFVQLMPSMGEIESRASKLLICDSWPYSLEFWSFLTGKTDFGFFMVGDPSKVIQNAVGYDPLRHVVIERLKRRETLDPQAWAGNGGQQPDRPCRQENESSDMQKANCSATQGRATSVLDASEQLSVESRAINQWVESIRTNDIDAIRVLIAEGGINDEDSEGWRPLHYAVDLKKPDMVRVLIEANADPNLPMGSNCDTLIDYAPDAYRPYGCTPLHLAAALDADDIVRILVAGGADCCATDSHGLAPLHVAARHGCLSATTALIESGADVDLLTSPNDDWCEPANPLYLAAERRHKDIVSYLIEHGARHNIFSASLCNDVDFLEQVVTVAPESVHQVRDGWQPIHHAALAGAIEAASVLLRAGGNIEAREGDDLDGYTALHIAMTEGHNPFMEWILSMGADPNASDSRGWSALYLAVLWDNPDAVRTLLKHGADVYHGMATETPLELALERQEKGSDCSEIIQMLRDAGASDEEPRPR
jgi:ankyrin repeat protein